MSPPEQSATIVYLNMAHKSKRRQGKTGITAKISNYFRNTKEALRRIVPHLIRHIYGTKGDRLAVGRDADLIICCPEIAAPEPHACAARHGNACLKGEGLRPGT